MILVPKKTTPRRARFQTNQIAFGDKSTLTSALSNNMRKSSEYWQWSLSAIRAGRGERERKKDFSDTGDRVIKERLFTDSRDRPPGDTPRSPLSWRFPTLRGGVPARKRKATRAARGSAL